MTANPTPFPPRFPKTLESAQRQYVEQFGSLLVTNRYLRLTILILFLALCGLLWLVAHTHNQLAGFRPLVIRIDDIGRAEAVRYDSFEHTPRVPEIRYFLTQWATMHFGRKRASLKDDFARSLLFLDSALAQAVIEQYQSTKEVESFIAGDGDEVEIDVRNIVIQNLQQQPFRAQVDFEKRYLSARDFSGLRREKYTATVDFAFRPFSNDLVKVNPLGLTITHFRTDQAFSEAKP